MYAITLRFAPTSSSEQLRATGELWCEYPDVHVHSRLAENTDGNTWVRELFLDRAGYLEVYHHYGLIGRRALYADGVHLGEEDFRLCHDTGTAVSHCPTSRTFLGSGLFPLHEAKEPRRPLHVGLGPDVGAGTTFSLLGTMGEACKVAQLCGHCLDPVRSLHLATLGNAVALDIDRHVGTLTPVREADLVVLDPKATPADGPARRAGGFGRAVRPLDPGCRPGGAPDLRGRSCGASGGLRGTGGRGGGLRGTLG